MPSPDQDSSLQALIAGDHPDELIFDPITDNDSTGSCLGCAYSMLGGAGVLVGLYAGLNRYGWERLELYLNLGGRGGWVALFLLVALSIFAVIETFSAKEIYVLDSDTGSLQLRSRRGKNSQVLKTWESRQMQRFILDPPGADPQANSCLYVMIHGEQIKLLESCYPRDFVEQVERAVSEICQVPSTT